MRFLFDYLLYRRRIIIVILTIAGVFLLFMLLYGVPVEAVIYSGVISAVITAAAAFGDFWRYYRKYKQLKELQGEIILTLDRLPECDNETERCYQELIELLHDEKTRLVSAADKRYDDASVYFTMWTHQIKTPLFAMRLALAESEFSATSELEEYLSKIEQYVEMALCYIHLDNEENDLVIDRRPLDGIIKQAVKKFSSQFIRRKIRILYDPVNIEILTDEKWLLFVVSLQRTFRVFSSAAILAETAERTRKLPELVFICAAVSARSSEPLLKCVPMAAVLKSLSEYQKMILIFEIDF